MMPVMHEMSHQYIQRYVHTSRVDQVPTADLAMCMFTTIVEALKKVYVCWFVDFSILKAEENLISASQAAILSVQLSPFRHSPHANN